MGGWWQGVGGRWDDDETGNYTGDINVSSSFVYNYYACYIDFELCDPHACSMKINSLIMKLLKSFYK